MAGTYKTLKKNIADNSIGRLYILHGEEDYLRDYYVNQMRTKLVSGVCESFNFHKLDGSKMNMDDLTDAVNALPMMSDKSMVVVNDLDIFKCDEQKRNRLIEIFSDVPDYCCLVFVYDTVEYKPDKRQKKLCAAIDGYAAVVGFAALDSNDLVDWIRRRFAADNHEITKDDARYLISICGGIMSGLIPEIGKISAFSKQRTVTRGDIDEVAEPTVEAVVFEMTNAIAANDFELAVAKLRVLFAQGEEPISLLALLGTQLRQMYSARLALSSGKDIGYLMELWGMRSRYAAEQRVKAARLFKSAWLKNAIALCCETDLTLKSTQLDKQLVLETLLFRLLKDAA